MGFLKSKFKGVERTDRLMSIGDISNINSISVYTDTISKITSKTGVSYIFRMPLTSPHSTSFRDLTIEVQPSGTKAFIATYFPTRKWIDSYKAKKSIPFDGEISFAKISLELSNLQEATAVINAKPGEKIMSVGNKIMDYDICTIYTVYITYAVPCTNGQHYPGDPNCDWNLGYPVPEGESKAYYYTTSSDISRCETIITGSGGAGGGGGGTGGGTTPNPPGGYDPCNGTPPDISIRFERGTRLAVIPPPPCDLDHPTINVSSAQFLISVLPIGSSAQQTYLNSNPEVAKELVYYLNQNGNTPGSKEFVRWAIEELRTKPASYFTTFSNQFLGINPFNDIVPPSTSEDIPLLNYGITIEDLPGYSASTSRIIGSSPNRGTSEDMQWGTSGDESGIRTSVLQQSNAELFNKMSQLIDNFTLFDTDMRTVAYSFIDRFASSVGGSYSNNYNLNFKVAQSNTYKNYIQSFGAALNNQLRRTGGDINNVQPIDMQVGPKFDGLKNKFNGLQILINDTEETQIRLDEFTINSGTWTANLTVTIKDHFGLDKHDALLYQHYQIGFAAWWTLQHKRGYKPFETVINLKTKITGHL